MRQRTTVPSPQRGNRADAAMTTAPRAPCGPRGMATLALLLQDCCVHTRKVYVVFASRPDDCAVQPGAPGAAIVFVTNSHSCGLELMPNVRYTL